MSDWLVEFTASGNPPSKSNSYRIVTIPNRGASLAKSSELKRWEELFALQIPPEAKRLNIEKTMRVEMDAYFPSWRSDLDNVTKAPLDVLQRHGVIKNDNRIIELYCRKFIDKENPRLEIKIKTLGA